MTATAEQRKLARALAATAKRKRTIVEPERCEECGTLAKLDMHHRDYDKPLAIVWLCRPCHFVIPRPRVLTEPQGKFRKLLRRAGITQRQAARDLGIAESTISRWPNGRAPARYFYYALLMSTLTPEQQAKARFDISTKGA